MLRLEIGDTWEPQDFIEVLESLESLYYISVILAEHHPFYRYEMRFPEYYRFEPLYSVDLDQYNRRVVDFARRVIPVESRIVVRQIQYASPGSLDLIGIGKVYEVIAGMIDRFLTFFAEREQRRQKDEQARLETKIKKVELEKERESLRELKLKNARELLALRSEYHGMLDEHFIALADRNQDKLITRIAEGKLVGAKTIKSDQQKSE